MTVKDVEFGSNWHHGLPWMHISLNEMRTSGTILTFEEVMTRLNAKDRAILDGEQNPSLPDLAAGARKNKNPEFDINFSIPATILKKLVPVQCAEENPSENIDNILPKLLENVNPTYADVTDSKTKEVKTFAAFSNLSSTVSYTHLTLPTKA